MFFSIYGVFKLRLVDEPGDSTRAGEVAFAAHHVPEDNMGAENSTSVLLHFFLSACFQTPKE